ncbi:hypothetical protein [Brevibacillus porteri]|uniref:hypothetical protein n=1 Tax=Brevibacillus porteri TaxID=2126350 RepID=UPI0036257D6A
MKEKVKSLLGIPKKGVVFIAAFIVLLVGAGGVMLQVIHQKATKNADGSETVSIQDPIL